MVQTVVAHAGDTADTRAAAWRQLVDLAAQNRADADIPGSVFDTLEAWRGDVPLASRQAAARSLVGLAIAPELFAYFARDALSVAAPLAGTARFAPEQWRALLPKLPSPVRALLRHRDNFDNDTRRALASLGPADRVIEAAPLALVDVPPALDPVGGGVPIRALVDRIAAYRRDHPMAPPQRGAEPDPEARADSFRFETGMDGVVIWVEGAPREALIGLSIARVAEAPDHGVDGQAAGAYRRRAPFRDTRLSVAGAGPSAGAWRISAVPHFDPRDGRFLGYRGAARRPRTEEDARVPASDGLYGSSLRADSLRQLVHELRTPLNAILGFAEMIEAQILGPAAQDYRTRARTIAGEARRLITAVDDLDTAARAESEALDDDTGAVDLAELLRTLARELALSTDARGAHLRFALDPAPPVAIDSRVAERMVSRLLAATIAAAAPGEAIDVRLTATQGGAAIAIDRPRALAGERETALLDPGYGPEGDWPDAPLLGLGFALRLVRNLAERSGGGFAIQAERFVLSLPIADAVDAVGKG